MNIEELLQHRRRRHQPTEDELHHLPFRHAFIYGRVSKPEQIRESEQSVKEIADLVALARSDGYVVTLPQEEVYRRIEAIQKRLPAAILFWEDSEIVVDCRDLGISGQLPAEKRPGLANLQRRLGTDGVGCLYLTEGMSRLSRDPDRVLSYQMLKVLKEKECRVRTPDGVWNPAIERDWEYLAEELEGAAEETKIMGRRLRRRRNNKAREGRHVGCPVVAGFIVEIEGQRPDGRYILGKWKAYPPHAEVVNIILRYLVRLRSPIKTSQALHEDGIVFPYFPPELSYMVNRTQLRMCPRTPAGYAITPALVSGLAQNPALIGVWTFSNQLPIIDNHDHIVPEDLLWEACGVALKERKPRGRAIKYEPLPFSGLLWCCNHALPQRVSAHPSDGSYVCNHDYALGQGAAICFDVSHYVLDIPLTQAILGQLDFTPYAEEVLAKLESDYNTAKIEENQRRRQETELEQRVKQLKNYLGSPDPEREETYWSLIKEAQAALELLHSRPRLTTTSVSLDIHLIRKLLVRLTADWDDYSPTMRNRLLHILLDRVELYPSKRYIEATIIWKVGLEQKLVIERPKTNGGSEKSWAAEEDEILRLLWHSTARKEIEAALPRRTWKGISLRALRLSIRRSRMIQPNETWRHWTEEEDQRLFELYTYGDSLADIAAELGRTHAGVACRIQIKGLSRPRPKQKRMPLWHLKSNNFIGSETACLEPYQNPTGCKSKGC